MIPVTVIRHPKERIKKCSLAHLHARSDFRFLEARPGFAFDATGFILLSLDAPLLSAADREYPLLVLDSTWRLLPNLVGCLTGEPLRRSLPRTIATAYPRSSKLVVDPERGLASVEAVYVARRILGDDDRSLLNGYRWSDAFLRQFVAGLDI